MKDFKIKFKLDKWHFYLLGFIFLNFGTELITGYSLNQNLIFFLKTLLYLTGLVMFFYTLKPFKLKTAYFSFYTISSILIGIFFLFGGIFFAILSSIVLYPIYPKQLEYKTDSIKIYERFQGFMAPCCSYEVVESNLLFFEKHLGFINIEAPIDTNRDEFRLQNDKIIYRHTVNEYDYIKQKNINEEKTEIINLE